LTLFWCYSGAVAVGLVISLLFGHFFAAFTRDGLYRLADIPEHPKSVKRIQPEVVGLIERAVFFLLAMYAASHPEVRLTDIAMPALFWIGLKMAVHWQVPMAPSDDEDRKAGIPAARAMTAILAGLISVLMGLAGGVVAAAITKTC